VAGPGRTDSGAQPAHDGSAEQHGIGNGVGHTARPGVAANRLAAQDAGPDAAAPAYAKTDGNIDADLHPDPTAAADDLPHTGADTGADADPHTRADTDPHRGSNPHAHTSTIPHAHTGANPHAHTGADAHPDTEADPHAHAGADPATLRRDGHPHLR
jgi:hypothetical protein